ncbi:MAG: alpha/beta hydrolase [candidate division KSB1 bacterium]|nr:alpha/beta hydrolase [candidate division KSB1 bacterium]
MTRILSYRMNSINSIQDLRTFSEKTSRPLLLPDGVTLQESILDGVPVEWIKPRLAVVKSVVLYIHGGAWVLGWNNNYRVLAAYIAQAANSRVVAVDYHLAPEHIFPVQLNDCLTAYRRLLKDGIKPDRIVLTGDSAGANLVLAVLMALRDAGETLPSAAVCMSPMTDLACTGETFHTNKDALLTSEFALSMSRKYAGNQNVRYPLISPHYGDLTGLPPILVQAGKHEILLSDAERLAENAGYAGVELTLTVWPKMWHLWHIFIPYLPEAKQAVDEIGCFIRKYQQD